MKFTENHEWLKLEGEFVVVGITKHASAQLGDIVFIELSSPPRQLNRDDEVAVIESVKAASEICAPIKGDLVEINEAIIETPSLVNEDPLGQGWFFKIRVSDPSEIDTFMDDAVYQALVG